MATVSLASSAAHAGQINRRVGVGSVAVTPTAGTCDVIDMRTWGNGLVIVPAAFTIDENASVYVASSADGEFTQLRDSTGNSLTIKLTTSKCVAMPDQAFAASFAKIVTATASGTVIVSAKS